jgi:CHASE2 domain-containing sensor protein
MLIRYLPSGIPTVSALQIRKNANLLRGKTVFLGVTALSAARDRLLNLMGKNVPGVEVHAHAFETMARGHFLRRASNLLPLGLSLLFAAGAGAAFALLSGWAAYGMAALVLIGAHVAPVVFFRQGIVFPYFGPAAVAWLSERGGGYLSALFRTAAIAPLGSGKSAVSAGHPLGRARNADAVDGHPGFERNHDALRAAG